MSLFADLIFSISDVGDNEKVGVEEAIYILRIVSETAGLSEEELKTENGAALIVN